MINKQSFLLSTMNTLLAKYHKNPEVCKYCGAPIIFESFVRQFDEEFKFCSAECKNHFAEIVKDPDFIRNDCQSATEVVILNFLRQQFPNLEIVNNDKLLYPPYEFDFVFPQKNVIIEYNGVYHHNDNFGDERLIKVQKRDFKKRKLICSKMQWNCISLCSPFGMYTRPQIFKKMLMALKMKLDELFSDFHYCYACSINADIDEKSIIITEESFLKSNQTTHHDKKHNDSNQSSNKGYYNRTGRSSGEKIGLKRKTKKKKRQNF